MSANIGQAELEVVPTSRGFGRRLESQLNSETPRASQRAGRNAGTGFAGGFGAALKRGGGLIAGGGLALGVAGLVKNSVQLEASFSKTMSQIGASTAGAGEHMDELNGLAKKLGAETTFSANDAAGAMLELGKAGINASDIMGGALSGTLLLAAAGGTDLATASTIASNAMNTFNLKGKDMAQIAAALAGGANASSASVESLGQGLQQVGPGATNAGLSLQETVGALSAFDAAGIKGSDAGTSLKTMLSRLVPQTDAAKNAMHKLGLDFTDANGKFVPLTNVAQQLKDKLGGLSEEQRTTALTTLFGSDATRAATVLMKEGSAGLGEYIKATKDQNAAQKLAKANMSGTSGAMERLSGSIETAELALGQALAPTVQKVANFLADEAVPAVTGFIEGMQNGTGAGGDFADILETVYKVGKGLVGAIDGLPGPVKKFGVQALIAALVLAKVNAGMRLVAATSVGRFATGMSTAATRTTTMAAASARMGAAMRQAGGIAGALALVDGVKKLDKQASGTKTALGGLEVAAGGAAVGFALGGPLGAAIGGTAGGLYGMVKAFGLFGTAAKKSTGPLKLSKKAIEDYAGTLDESTGAITKNTRAMVLQRLESSGLLTSTRKLGLTDREAVNAMTGNKAAREKLSHALRTQTGLTDQQREALRLETGAVGESRLKQLKHNIAIADSAHELKLAQRALRKFMAEPANKHVGITGVEDVRGQLNSIRIALNQVFGRAADLNLSLNGLGTLPAGATGGIVRRPTLALIGEAGPEAVVPLNRTPGSSPLPAMSSTSSSGADRFVLVLDDGTSLGGYIDRRADSRVGASTGMGAMSRRAGGR